MILAPDPADAWLAHVTSYQRSLLRLEQQPAYVVDAHSGAMDQWLAGGPALPSEGPEDPWCRMVRQRLAATGATVDRIRVLEEPPTRYQQWLVEASSENVDAGESIRYLNRSEADTAGITADAGDWWLVDRRLLVQFTFEGTRLEHVEVAEDPDRVEAALRLVVGRGPVGGTRGGHRGCHLTPRSASDSSHLAASRIGFVPCVRPLGCHRTSLPSIWGCRRRVSAASKPGFFGRR